MQINIISIGKFSSKCPNKELFFDYAKKTKWKINLIEISSKISGSVKEVKEKEGNLIKKHLDNNAKIILLDEKGSLLDSKEFAQKISNFQNNSIKKLYFIIGGANGVSEEIKNMADLKIAFGKMTFPHMMVRALISEQIYRAYLIINNHPYHKD